MKNWISSRRGLIAGGALVSVAGMMMGGSRVVAAPEGMTHSKNIDLILTFCKAGQDRDLEKQMSYIDEDSIYHNMPDAPIVGRAGILVMASHDPHTLLRHCTLGMRLEKGCATDFGPIRDVLERASMLPAT